MPAKKPVLELSYLDAFRDMLVAERGASRHTLDAYLRDIQQAASWLSRHKIDIAVAGQKDVTGFVGSLEGLAAKSRARKLSSLRQYYRFLISEGKRKDDPTAQIDAPKLGRSLPGVPSPEEMERLFTAVEGDAPENIRLRLMLELGYGSGLRVSELVSLPLSALRPDSRAMIVRGKGEKERLVPLSEATRHALQDYLKVRATFIGKGKTSAFLFPSTGKAGFVTRIRFYQMLKDVAVKAGVPHQKIHPHALRHAFATHVLAGGADLRALQTMLGHADIGTTQIYTHVVRDHLKVTVEKHHPLAKKRG